MMLTPEQQSHFETFGFIVQRGLFSPDEMSAITREFDDVMAKERDSKPFAGEGQAVVRIVEQHPKLRPLAEDDRIYKTIEQLMGTKFIWSGSEGNLTVHSEHRWHADRPGKAEVDYMRIKVMLYLDAVTEDNGCIRVIPGSHRLPLHTDLEPLIAQKADSTLMTFGVSGPELPYFPLETEPGDVVFFNHCLWHAMFNGWVGRRYIALKFAAAPTTQEHIASLHRWSPYAFEPDEAFLNSTQPRIRSMVENLVELGQNG